MNQKLILILTLTLVSISSFAQTFNENIKRVFEIQREMTPREYWITMISDIVESNTSDDPNLNDDEIEKIKQQLIDNEIPQINSDLLALFKKYYSEKDIETLLNFYESSVGQKLRKVSEAYFEDSQSFESNTTEMLRHKVEDAIIATKGKYENIQDVDISTGQYFEVNFENETNILIDFGDVTGLGKVTKVVKIKNTNKRGIMLSSLFSKYRDTKMDELTIDFGGKILMPEEVREIKFILDTKCVQGKNEYNYSLEGNGNSISCKLIYYSETTPIRFSVEDDKLLFEDFDGSLSEIYTFKIQNSGFSYINIKSVRSSSKIIYINYNQELISKGEETEINVIYSKELMEKHKESEVNVMIEVDIQRCNHEHFFETIQLNVEK